MEETVDFRVFVVEKLKEADNSLFLFENWLLLLRALFPVKLVRWLEIAKGDKSVGYL